MIKKIKWKRLQQWNHFSCQSECNGVRVACGSSYCITSDGVFVHTFLSLNPLNTSSPAALWVRSPLLSLVLRQFFKKKTLKHAAYLCHSDLHLSHICCNPSLREMPARLVHQWLITEHARINVTALPTCFACLRLLQGGVFKVYKISPLSICNNEFAM